MGLTREPDRLPGPLFPFSLGVLDARAVGDQTKSGHTKCVLVGRRPRTVVLRPARRRHGERWLRPNVNKPADLVRSKAAYYNLGRGFIARSTKMRRSIGRLSVSALSHHGQSSTAFITNIAESDF